jgi:hypothetical protein
VDILIRLYHKGMVKNQADVKDLLDNLRHQLEFIQDKTSSLTDSRFRPSRSSIQGLVKSIEAYILFVVFLDVGPSLITHRKLDSLQAKLESLNPKDKGRIRKFLHKISSVDSDREEIDSCTRQLDGSFQQFMVRFMTRSISNGLFPLRVPSRSSLRIKMPSYSLVKVSNVPAPIEVV